MYMYEKMSELLLHLGGYLHPFGAECAFMVHTIISNAV
jgi:hypothetical protein